MQARFVHSSMEENIKSYILWRLQCLILINFWYDERGTSKNLISFSIRSIRYGYFILYVFRCKSLGYGTFSDFGNFQNMLCIRRHTFTRRNAMIWQAHYFCWDITIDLNEHFLFDRYNATLTLGRISCDYECLNFAMNSPKSCDLIVNIMFSVVLKPLLTNILRIVRTLYQQYQWLTNAYENQWRITVFTTFAEI